SFGTGEQVDGTADEASPPAGFGERFVAYRTGGGEDECAAFRFWASVGEGRSDSGLPVSAGREVARRRFVVPVVVAGDEIVEPAVGAFGYIRVAGKDGEQVVAVPVGRSRATRGFPGPTPHPLLAAHAHQRPAVGLQKL